MATTTYYADVNVTQAKLGKKEAFGSVYELVVRKNEGTGSVGVYLEKETGNPSDDIDLLKLEGFQGDHSEIMKMVDAEIARCDTLDYFYDF